MKIPRLLISSLCLCLILGLFAPAAFAAKTYTVRPPGGGWFVYNDVEPGSELEGVAEVVNLGSETVRLWVFPLDATLDSLGNFALKNIENEQFGIGSWVAIEDNITILEPGQSSRHSFSIAIPENVEPGLHAGGILVTELKDEDAEASDGMFDVRTRVGARTYITIAGSLIDGLDWTVFEKGDVMDGKQSILMKLENTGNSTLKVNADVEIDSLFSEDQSYNIALGNFLPGSKTESFAVEKPILDIMKVKVTLNYERTSLFNLELEDVEQMSITKNLRIIVIPWRIVILILLAFVLLAWKIYRNRQFVKSCVAYKVKSGETIMEISFERGCSWKKLARINRLKSPFILKKGMKLMVPPKPKSKPKKK